MYKSILIPIDLYDKSSIKPMMIKGLNFAQAFGSIISFIYVIPDFGIKTVEDYLPKHWIKDQKNKYSSQITDLVKQYVPEEINVNISISRGSVYDKVIQYSNEIDADLIIVSAIRPQFRDYMLGPNASKIVRHASISVLVVRE
jgi:universal stress protein F